MSEISKSGMCILIYELASIVLGEDLPLYLGLNVTEARSLGDFAMEDVRTRFRLAQDVLRAEFHV